MLRRGFLKRMAFSALATVYLEIPLPKELSHDERATATYALSRPLHYYKTTTFSLGFKISETLMEDNLYSAKVKESMLSEWRKEMITRFNTDLDIHQAS